MLGLRSANPNPAPAEPAAALDIRADSETITIKLPTNVSVQFLQRSSDLGGKWFNYSANEIPSGQTSFTFHSMKIKASITNPNEIDRITKNLGIPNQRVPPKLKYSLPLEA